MKEEKKSEISVWKDISMQAAKDAKNNISAQITSSACSMSSSIIYSCADFLTKIVTGIITKGKGRPYQSKSNNSPYRSNDPNKYSNVSRRVVQAQPDIGLRRSDVPPNVTVDSWEKANSIQADLVATIEHFGCVRVSDLYEKVNIIPGSTDCDWGWINTNDIHFVPDGDRFRFDLPTPVRLR